MQAAWASHSSVQNYNLLSVNRDRKNPNATTVFERLPPEQLAEDILKKEQRIAEIVGEFHFGDMDPRIFHTCPQKVVSQEERGKA